MPFEGEDKADQIVPPSPPSSGASDTMAQQESDDFQTERLRKEAAKNRHDQDQNLKRHVHRATIVLFWVAVAGLISMIVVYLIHMLTPWCFVPPERLETIKSILVGAAASSVMTGYARKILGLEEKPSE